MVILAVVVDFAEVWILRLGMRAQGRSLPVSTWTCTCTYTTMQFGLL